MTRRCLASGVGVIILIAGCGGDSGDAGELELAGTFDGGAVSVDANATNDDTSKNTGPADSVTNKQASTRDAAEGTRGNQSFTATTEGGRIKRQSPQGTKTSGADANTKLPENIADDIPTHPAMNVMSVVHEPDENRLLYQARIESPAGSVLAHYEQKAASAGWSLMNKRNEIGMNLVNYEKSDRKLAVSVLPTGGSGCQVSVTVVPIGG